MSKELTKQQFERAYSTHHEWTMSHRKQGERLVLKNRTLGDCSFEGKNLAYAHFVDCDFEQADLKDADFEGAKLQNCDLSQTRNLSIEALAWTNLLSTNFPEGFSFERQIESANQLSAEHKRFTSFYLFAGLYFILSCFLMSDTNMLLGRMPIPNPFFELKETISIMLFLTAGMTLIFMLDRMLIPYTVDAVRSARNLPQIFPTGERITTVLSNSAGVRWAVSRQSDAEYIGPDDMARGKKMKSDYVRSISFFYALEFSMRHLVGYTALAKIMYHGLGQRLLYQLADSSFKSASPIPSDSAMALSPLALMMAFTVFCVNASGLSLNIVSRAALAGCAIALVIGHIELSIGLAALAVVALFWAGLSPFNISNIYSALLFITLFYACHFFFSHVDVAYKSLSVANKHPDALYEYAGPDLRGLQLGNISARGLQAPQSDMRHATLEGAEFSYSNLAGSDFRHANVNGMRIDHANLTGVRGITDAQLCTMKGYRTARLDHQPVCMRVDIPLPVSQTPQVPTAK